MIGYDRIDVERMKGVTSQLSVNYSTRWVKRSAGHISDAAEKVMWTTLPPEPLLTIEQVGDGLEFSPTPK